MTLSQIETKVRYLTNAAGEKTDVLVPVDLWEALLEILQASSGLDSIDEQEPNSQILADLQIATRQAQAGQTFPISELWQDITAE
ncbi:MAG: hypothetical protein F6J97_23455 [Leptolyngbya sp. SIO4C1]|nr:hypothetical protein [Leptolyngbya sp. SIO4C1]